MSTRQLEQQESLMKTIALATLAATAILSMNVACAADFAGAYVQLDGGLSHTKATGSYQADKKDVGSAGVEAGYLWNVGHNVLVGVDGFFDYNARENHDTAAGGQTRYGSNVYGSDFIGGYQFDSKWFVYGKVGAAHVRGIEGADGFSKTALHYGTGVQYEVMRNVAVGVEYTNTHAKDHGDRLNNDNTMLTLSYSFGELHL
jgi:opacity protein-like surface antigen